VITALALLGYAVCAAWCVPVLLAPLTRRGASVRAGLAAWLTAMASVLVSAAVAIEISFRTVAADWPQLTQALCRSVAGSACTPAIYRSALYEGGTAALAIVSTLLAAVALWRYVHRVQRSRRQTRVHAEAARLVGRALPDGIAAASGGAPGAGAIGRRHAEAVVLDDPRPAAYCVAGRPAAIVLTSGALQVLDQPQLGAVLAHERAHLAHGDHLLQTLTQGLAAAFPGVPLFTRGAAEVARLTEMGADDTAARASSRPALVAALLAIATGTVIPTTGIPGTGIPGTGISGTGAGTGSTAEGTAGVALPSSALPAAARAVPDRVERLLSPSSPARSAVFTAALAFTLAILAAAPSALTLLPPR
jgi:Zn-dependent protease with chaperone function